MRISDWSSDVCSSDLAAVATPKIAALLAAPYQPAGDQPQAIARLADGFEAGLAAQTLLGVTGSGKTYTIANVIERDRKSVVSGKTVSVRVDPGGRRIIKKTTYQTSKTNIY